MNKQTEEEEEKAGFLKFTEKEILKMPSKFRKEIKINGRAFRQRKRKRGKNSCSIEIRYRRNGLNISASGRTQEEAKANFIRKLQAAENKETQQHYKAPETFQAFALYYLDNFKKRKVAKETYKNDLYRLKRYIFPLFGDTPLKDISPLQCQKLLDEQTALDKYKTAEELHSLMNQIFKIAIKHGILQQNPIDIVVHKVHEREHGKALTKEEEEFLLSSTEGSLYQIMFAVALYTGLRPNEYKTARIEGKFIVAKNSKRHNGKVEYKKIPITPMLEPYLRNVKELLFYIPECIRKKFKSILPNHRLYDLRTTFYTRCRMCGIADAARDEFMGHSSGKLSAAYTDLPDEYLLSEGKKFKY